MKYIRLELGTGYAAKLQLNITTYQMIMNGLMKTIKFLKKELLTMQSLTVMNMLTTVMKMN